jgi:hypothetical protein
MANSCLQNVSELLQPVTGEGHQRAIVFLIWTSGFVCETDKGETLLETATA